MTPAELQAIRERADNATPGPWTRNARYGDICGPNGEELFYGADSDGTVWARELDDAIFATRARTDIPDLLDHVDTLTAQVAAVRDLHQERPNTRSAANGAICSCAYIYPCPTIQALDKETPPPPDPPLDPLTYN